MIIVSDKIYISVYFLNTHTTQDPHLEESSQFCHNIYIYIYLQHIVFIYVLIHTKHVHRL